MDQIAALEWVQQNIHRFGGDPANVTILGCSAGGSSINALMSAPAANGLFHKACARSGGGFFNATRSLAVAEEQGEAFSRLTGQSGSEASLAALRSLDADSLLALEQGPPNFGAVVDGVVLPEATSSSFRHGRIANVPYMAGSTSDEASVFGLMGFDRQVLASRFGIDVDAQRAAYGAAIDDAELLRQVQTDFIFTSAAIGMTTLAANAGRPAWAYYFDYVRTAELGSAPGAPHCADMPFALGTLVAADEDEARMAARMQAQLLAFIRTGNPQVDGDAEWPRFSAGSRAPLVIDRAGMQAREGFRDAQLQPWYRKWETVSGERFPR
jgi:para-nitrobenzyl esterase